MRIYFSEAHSFIGVSVSAPDAPFLPVTLYGRRGLSASTFALLDSGADTPMFHANWARKIGLQLRRGRMELIAGIDPTTDIQGWVHRIDIVVGGMKAIRCEVFFSEEIGEDISDQLIGRGPVFDALKLGIRSKVGLTYVGRE